MTYEYLCTTCGHEWEAEQSISEAPLKTCPNCGNDTAKRQVSGGMGFILKGGGWYADGYGSKGESKPNETKDAGKSSPSKKEGKKPNGIKPDAPKSDAPKPDAPSSGGDSGKGGQGSSVAAS